MERLPLHIGLFLVYVLFQMVSQSLSSSSTEASNRSPDLVHASTRASQEGQKEQLLDDIASSEGPVDDSSDKTVSVSQL